MTNPFYDYYEAELRDCIVDSLIALGFKAQAEMVRDSILTPDLINKLIETIKRESSKKGKPLDERLYFLGFSY